MNKTSIKIEINKKICKDKNLLAHMPATVCKHAHTKNNLNAWKNESIYSTVVLQPENEGKNLDNMGVYIISSVVVFLSSVIVGDNGC